MNNQAKIGVVGGIILIMVFMVWMFSSGSNNVDPLNKGRKPFVSSNWSKKFELYDKKPMGLYLFTSLAKAHIDSSHKVMIANDWEVLDSLMNRNNEDKTYLFVGNNFGLYTDEFTQLLNKVNLGSEMFLAYNSLTDNVEEELFLKSDPKFDYSPEINIFTSKRKFPMINLFQNDTIACDWNAFGDIKTIGSYKTLSSFMEVSNFIRIKYGKGKIHLVSTPGVFYNYQLKRMYGYKYAEYALNQIPKNQDIILLEIARLSSDYDDEELEEEEGENLKEDDSYLKLLFNNPTLLKAMLLAILGVILFVVFRSKRTRPIVPYIGDKKDMTLAFAETITSIYYSKRNPYGLLQVQKKNFHTMVQKHFFLDLSRSDQDNVRNSLAEKSNLTRIKIDELLSLFEKNEGSEVTDQYVANVLSQQQEFYKSVGIISDKTTERIKKREIVYNRSLLLPSIFILSGVFLFSLGVFYLVGALGVGIIFWPIGICLIVLGIIRLSKPYLIVNDKDWTYYSPLGKKTTFTEEEITHIEILTSGAIIGFGANKKLIINYWDLSRFDQKQFKRHISKLHTL